MMVNDNSRVVEGLAEAMQPAPLHSRVELIAMQHEEVLTACRAMHPLAMHFHLPMHERGERRKRRVVVTRNVDQARARAPFGEQELHDARMVFGPAEPLA